MKTKPLIVIMTGLLICSACMMDRKKTLFEHLKSDFIAFAATGWKSYTISDYFSHEKFDYSFLTETFDIQILDQAVMKSGTELRVLNKEQRSRYYDMGIVVLEYATIPIASAMHSKITHQGSKNLKGGKILISYTSRQCAKSIAIFYSLHSLTGKIKKYFRHVERDMICR